MNSQIKMSSFKKMFTRLLDNNDNVLKQVKQKIYKFIIK